MSEYEAWDVALSAIQTAAVIIGFYFARKQLKLVEIDLRTAVELASRQQAMNMIARYAEHTFAQVRANLRTDPSVQQSYHDCCALLNFFEEVAIARKHGTANERILKDAFATALRSWMKETYIVAALNKAQEKDPGRYENVVGLFKDWGGAQGGKRAIGAATELPVSDEG